MRSALIALMLLACTSVAGADAERDAARRANFVAIAPAPARAWPANQMVIPGDGANSKLVKAMLGTSGPRMPIGGQPVALDQIAAVKAWIDAGAEEAEFVKTVQPIFEASCTGCHGAHASTLSLDSFQALQDSVAATR